MLILTEAQVRRCLSIDNCIAANRVALGSLRRNTIDKDTSPTALVPSRIGLPRHPNQQLQNTSSPDMTLFKPAAYYPQEESDVLMGLKVVSTRAKNGSIGKPTVPATIIMLDAESGDVNAMLAGTYLTAARTAAGSAIATKLCLDCRGRDRGNVTNTGNHLVVFGAGLQAEMHIRCIHHILPGQIGKVTIINRTRKRAQDLQELLLADPDTSQLDLHIIVLEDKDALKEAVETADIIVTATNTIQPLFDWTWVNTNCHINGVGSYLPSSEEVDCNFVRDHCITIVDTIEALQVGDLRYLDESSDRFAGLLGDVLNDDATIGSKTRSKCTFFKSCGTAIQDILTSNEVVMTATRLGIGTRIEM